ncbi:MAG: hypothetical protein SWX82_31340 [Cyanobacteriota bacterium]|nr:hypothetical protein [Cyanobacteriota bacterium]
MPNKIDIHEFSTGIEVKGTPNGWESGGFTGEYMNRTIDQIPRAVLDSIANREFALAEGVVTADPAIVGRIVRGDGEIWSVVAVVTRGRDDRGRGVSLYRYFLCQGDGHIETILRWMKKPLVFDPFDKKAIGEHDPVNPSSQEVPLDEFQEILKQSSPICVPAAKSCTPLLLNEMTRKLKRNGDRAWAYKVAMLERPEYFQVIYPADSQAEMVIREALNRRQSLPVPTSGESGIKTAIQAVMNGRVKHEHIETLDNALGNPQLDENYWKSILDKEGASQAFSENIYGDRYVRLLTLKAMLIPQFLPYFLDWLAESKEWKTHYATSLSLQKWMLQEAPKFTDDFPNLSERLKFGICYVIDELVDEPQILKQSQSLLTESGLWSQFYQKSLSKELEVVLSLMGNYIEQKQKQKLQSLRNQYPQWSSLLNKINKFWYPPEQHDRNYRNWTRLFEKVGTAKLATIFYQIGEGTVPKPLFDKFSRNKSEFVLFKKKIYRRKDLGDSVQELTEKLRFFFCVTVEIGEISMSKFKALIILLVVFTGGFASGRFSLEFQNFITGSLLGKTPNDDVKNGENQQIFPKQNNGKTEGNQEESGTIILSEENQIKYKDTDDAIDRITKLFTSKIRELAEEKALERLEIPKEFYRDLKEINNKGIVIHCIKKIIKLPEPEKFQYSAITENDANWQKFSNAIYDYQVLKKGSKPDGVISPEGNTRGWLEDDIRSQCLKLQ